MRSYIGSRAKLDCKITYEFPVSLLLSQMLCTIVWSEEFRLLLLFGLLLALFRFGRRLNDRGRRRRTCGWKIVFFG